MSARELRLELLLGRTVTAANGRSVGRIEEVRAEARGTGAVVTHYLLGPDALLERLSVHRLRGGRRGYVARPDQLDLNDPRHPRLLVSVEDLERA
jgi:hypothetical protein